MRRVWRRTKTICPDLQKRVRRPPLRRLQPTRRDRAVLARFDQVLSVIASHLEMAHQRVASLGGVCTNQLRRRGSAERRAGLRARIEGGAPAQEHYLFLRTARFWRSSMKYASCRDPLTALRQRMRELARTRVRFGYQRLRVLLLREGREVGKVGNVTESWRL
jgi:hypothetical protein